VILPFTTIFKVRNTPSRFPSSKIACRFLRRDPFDHIIVWQAIVENINFISADAIFDDYLKDKSIKRIW